MNIFPAALTTGLLFALLGNFDAKKSGFVKSEIYDNFLETWKAPENLKKNYPCYLSGYDKKGRPIWIFEFGKWDVKKVVDGGSGSGKTQEFDAFTDQLLSRVIQSTNKKDMTSDKKKGLGWVCIFDMEGYNYRQLMSFSTLSYVKTLAEKLEIGARKMDFGFLINLNTVAAKLVNQMKPLLGTTLDKTEIHGTDKAEWLPSILKRLPKYSLPQKYGGYANFTLVEL